MRAALEWIAVFVGALLVVAVLSTAVSALLGRQPQREGAVRFVETYDVDAQGPYINAAGASISYWDQAIDGVDYRAVELASPYPFSVLRLSVEGAQGELEPSAASVGGAMELQALLPKDTWAGVELEIDCAP